ncbi:hypothetical protein NUW58_g5810 [Xylaria curta]|uniref:Uncharacterized protein n=1 Tax=Xylaria curta TaxID=42375 RepID=A0ACC1NZV0_9PEZI|nr:hypothetical protein NUW58_g5810 [Xylaria curta]
MASVQDPAQGGEVSAVDRRKMLILYGSETGNSEESANDIERMARRLRFRTSLEEMDDVELRDLLQYPFVVFVIATTGQGDLPRNARKFWKSLLRKRLPPNCLRQVNFTTFGLGDSSYFQYNWAARKLHKRLEQLGATEFIPRGEADERHEDGIDGTFLPWCLTLRTYLEQHCPLPPGLLPIPPEVQLPPKFTIELAAQNSAADKKGKEMAFSRAKPTDTPRADNSGGSASVTASEGTTPHKETLDERRARYNVDNHGRKLDTDAALFSHVDDSPARVAMLKREHERKPLEFAHARCSDGIAGVWPGGVDILDKPNVLKDAPTKYSLEDPPDLLEAGPPPRQLPIPNSWGCVLDGNTRLTPNSHWQDVRKISIRCYDKAVGDGKFARLMFSPGDVAVIYPKNFPQDVQALIDLMGWGDVADQPFQHVPQGLDIPCLTPKNCYPLENSTLRELLTHNYDITCIPRRTFFTEISYYTEDSTHKERLREFADPSHSDEFWDYTSRPRRSILEVLQDFPSVRVPYQHVPAVFPVIRGREYSIAGSGDMYSEAEPDHTRFDLVIALVKYKTVLRKTRQGLCSRYIRSLMPGTPIRIKFRRNSLPPAILEPNTPLLAIAPGTGVAPIRALIQERAFSENQGETHLFYGGRNREADFFFQDEWTDFGIKVTTAFSRDQPSKIYVQDRLLEKFETVCNMLRKGSAICLCGSAGKMPEAVRLALYDCMVKGGLAADREQAKETLHKHHVFWEEVW